MAMIKALMDWLIKSKPAAQPAEPKQKNFVPTQTSIDAALAVLVANMDGPDGATISGRIADGLSRLSGVHVSRTDQHITIPNGTSMTDSLVAASELGRDCLFKHDADILIWGAVGETGAGLTVRFLPLNPVPDGRPGAFGLGDQLDIPVQFSAEIADVIAACAVATGGPTRNGSRTAAMKLVHESMDRIRLLAESGLGSLDAAQRLTVLIAVANVVATDSRGKGGQDSLRDAISIYGKAIAAIPTDTDGVRRALLHSHLALALQAMASGDEGTESLEQAVASYQAAIAVLHKSSHAQDWAMAHMRLGLALYRLAVKSGRSKLMKEAVLALKQALTVFTKESSPGKWAEVMNHIGVIMTGLGEDMANNKILEQALKIFGEALVVRKREMVPTLWAQTNNNMGAAAFALAKRTKNKAMMEQAAMAFEGAVDVYRQSGKSPRIHVIEKNLKLVQRRLEVM